MDLPPGAQLETDDERLERHAKRLGLRPTAWEGDGLKIEARGRGLYRVTLPGEGATKIVPAAGVLALLGVRGA